MSFGRHTPAFELLQVFLLLKVDQLAIERLAAGLKVAHFAEDNSEEVVYLPVMTNLRPCGDGCKFGRNVIFFS